MVFFYWYLKVIAFLVFIVPTLVFVKGKINSYCEETKRTRGNDTLIVWLTKNRPYYRVEDNPTSDLEYGNPKSYNW